MRIYRGYDSSHGPVFSQNTKSTIRSSAHTSNFVTIATHVLPSWTDGQLPPRSSGISCTTDIHTADQFGDVHVVLPRSDCELVYCGAEDFWQSFPQMPIVAGVDAVNELNANIQYIANVMMQAGLITGKVTSANDVEVFCAAVDSLADGDHPDTEDAIEDNPVYKSFIDGGYMGFMDFLDEALRPEVFRISNNGKLLTPTNRSGMGEEVFLSGSVIYVSLTTWMELMKLKLE